MGDAPQATQSDVWMDERTSRVRASLRETVKFLPCGSISSSQYGRHSVEMRRRPTAMPRRMRQNRSWRVSKIQVLWHDSNVMMCMPRSLTGRPYAELGGTWPSGLESDCMCDAVTTGGRLRR